MADKNNTGRTVTLADIRFSIRQWAVSVFTVFIVGTILLMWPLALVLWRDADGVLVEVIWLPVLAAVFALSPPGRRLGRKMRSRDIR
jgi:hypothetical protein